MHKVLQVLLALALGGCAPEILELGQQEQRLGLSQVKDFGSNPGNLAMYVHVPPDMPSTPAPVVVVMHGCYQDADEFTAAGWNELADELKFYVVYPQTNTFFQCFGWSESSNTKRGEGEPLSIKQMVDQLVKTHPVDPARVYAAGFSAGGAMTAVMLATYPDVFAAGVSIAGLPYGCGAGCMYTCYSESAQSWGDRVRGAFPGYTGPRPRVAIWQGTKDLIVDFSNFKGMVDQWTNANGIAAVPDATTTVGPATRREFRDNTGVRVESWELGGMAHGAPVDPADGCGKSGDYFLDVGLCSTRWAARFFDLYPAPGPDAGQPGPDAAAPGPDAQAAGPDAAAPGPDASTPRDAGYDAGSPDAGYPKLLPGRCGCTSAEGALPGAVALLLALALRRSRRG